MKASTDQMETNSLSEYLAIFLVVGNNRFGKLGWPMKIAEELAEEGCFREVRSYSKKIANVTFLPVSSLHSLST